jgi:hypothetical protein
MKKLLLLAAVSIFGLTASAQTEKGNVVLGGSVFYTSTENNPDNGKISSVGIIPNAGYFIADNFAVGLGLGYWQAVYDQNVSGSIVDRYRELLIMIQNIIMNLVTPMEAINSLI